MRFLHATASFPEDAKDGLTGFLFGVAMRCCSASAGGVQAGEAWPTWGPIDSCGPQNSESELGCDECLTPLPP
jgi:hypothetical protein